MSICWIKVWSICRKLINRFWTIWSRKYKIRFVLVTIFTRILSKLSRKFMGTKRYQQKFNILLINSNLIRRRMRNLRKNWYRMMKSPINKIRLSRTTKMKRSIMKRKVRSRNNSLKSRIKEYNLNKSSRKTKAAKENLTSKTQRKNKNRGSNRSQFKKKNVKSRA